jgi:hypothetical protein
MAHHPESEAMSILSATLPAEQAVHAMVVIDAHARVAKRQPGDTRSADDKS